MFTHSATYYTPQKMSVAQALLNLIIQSGDNQENQAELTRLFFLGAYDIKSAAEIDTWLETIDPNLIDTTPEKINNDSMRRYFETHLAYETLLLAVKEISYDDLQQYYDFIFNYISERHDADELKIKIRQVFNNKNTSFTDIIDQEYNDALRKLEAGSEYADFTPHDREKMALLFKCSYMCAMKVTDDKKNFPFDDIYREHCYFQKENRGQVFKDKNEQARVKSKHFGIMKSYMPIPHYDNAYAFRMFSYCRPADRLNYDPKARWIANYFKELVHPFSCSISGTFLLALSVLKHAHNHNELPFDTFDKFKKYIKFFITLMMFNSGGHSFREFTFPLTLPDVQERFKCIKDFNLLTMEYLFLTDNQLAFKRALLRTKRYHEQIIKRQNVLNEIKSTVPRQPYHVSDKEYVGSNALILKRG